MHLILHSRRGRRHNHLWQIFWWSVKGCRFCGGSKIALSHWQSQSPLTQGWRYRAACDPSASETSDVDASLTDVFYVARPAAAARWSARSTGLPTWTRLAPCAGPHGRCRLLRPLSAAHRRQHATTEAELHQLQFSRHSYSVIPTEFAARLHESDVYTSPADDVDALQRCV